MENFENLIKGLSFTASFACLILNWFGQYWDKTKVTYSFDNLQLFLHVMNSVSFASHKICIFWPLVGILLTGILIVGLQPVANFLKSIVYSSNEILNHE